MSAVRVFSPQSQCARKKPYASKAFARLVARRYATRGLGRMEPYRCPHCGHWHIGHPPAGS